MPHKLRIAMVQYDTKTFVVIAVERFSSPKRGAPAVGRARMRMIPDASSKTLRSKRPATRGRGRHETYDTRPDRPSSELGGRVEVDRVRVHGQG